MAASSDQSEAPNPASRPETQALQAYRINDSIGSMVFCINSIAVDELSTSTVPLPHTPVEVETAYATKNVERFAADVQPGQLPALHGGAIYLLQGQPTPCHLGLFEPL